MRLRHLHPCVSPLEPRDLPAAAFITSAQLGAMTAEVGVSGSAPVVAPTTTVPVPGQYTFVAKDYQTLHAEYVASQRSVHPPKVVLYGDSITYLFARIPGTASARLAGMGIAAYGVMGDRTENLIWRLQNGEIAGRPRVAVLLIGVNNLIANNSSEFTANGISSGVDFPEHTVAGVLAAVDTIRRASPETRVLVVGILPTAWPTISRAATTVNLELKAYAPALGYRFLDLSSRFVTRSGHPRPKLFMDFVHPSAAGNRILANGILPAARFLRTH